MSLKPKIVSSCLIRSRTVSSLSFLAWMVVSTGVLADTTIGSWNLLHLGWGNAKRLDLVAKVAANFDLLAVQEVMNEEALESLTVQLERDTGDDWDFLVSHTIGRGSYKEAYGFLYRTSRVDYVDGAVVFLDNRDVFAREPFSARFRLAESGQLIAMGNIHVLYGDTLADRLPEINALADYWGWLHETYPDTPVILAGDFNVNGSNAAWGVLRDAGAVDIVNDGATTLSSHNGRYANQYDHIWIKPAELDVIGTGKMPFPELLGITHEVARASVSDHAPLMMVIE